MDGRKRWAAFDKGKDTFKFPRTQTSEYYNQHYNVNYNASYSEPQNANYSEPQNVNYSGPQNANYSEHSNANYSEAYPAPLGTGTGPAHYNSDVSFQRLPTEAGVQRAPWNQNKTEAFCCCPAHEGNLCATLAAALPALLGAAGGQGGMMMKPFLPFAINNNTAAPPAPPPFPNFNTMDPVQKAVVKHTFGGRGRRVDAPVMRRRQPVNCDVCQINFNSDGQAQAHYRGGRHAKKLKMQQSKDELGKLSGNTARDAEAASSTGKGDAEQAKKLLYCSLCNVSVNSSMQLDAHNSGTKHKTMSDTCGASASAKAFPLAGVKAKSGPAGPAGPPSKGSVVQNKSFQCETCNVHVNSEIQLKQHLSSNKHNDRVAGKPSKPKFNKSQRMEVTTSSDSSTSLPGSSSSLAPAPGPIRASQGSALFSPY